MRRVTLQNLILIAAMLAVPATARAQRVPAAESAAIGGDVGVFVPRDDALGTGPALAGFYEYYLSARESIRMGVGWANPKFDREDTDKLRHVRIFFDLLHNWERGEIHPFVGAGLGVYFLQLKDNGRNSGDSHSKIGGTIFGGAEVFLSPTLSFKGEAQYHLVRKIGGLNPDGLALLAGLKKYF